MKIRTGRVLAFLITYFQGQLISKLISEAVSMCTIFGQNDRKQNVVCRVCF